MSETGDMLVDSATRMLSDLVTRDRIATAEAGRWPAELWSAATDMGLDRAAETEDRGGAGEIDVRDLCGLLRVLGRLSVPLPLAETWLAARLAAAAGLPVLDDKKWPATIGSVISGDPLRLIRSTGKWLLSGSLSRVPWARFAKSIVVVVDSEDGPRTLVTDVGNLGSYDLNYANEPRDGVVFDGVVIPDETVGVPGVGSSRDDLVFEGALFRGAQMIGAMERVLEQTVQYAKERVQFGRPIGKFQAVQQQIAVLAGEVAAASAAGHGAADARAEGMARFEIACAKIRIGEAAGKAAAIAHQVHGAMGFTHEHTLHLSTRRLWAWRDEFGSEAEWSAWVGQAVSAVGGEALWSFITDPRGSVTSKSLW